MPKLSDTQAVLLAAAAARSDLSVLPPSETLTLKGAALERTLSALIRRGLIAETAVERRSRKSKWVVEEDVLFCRCISSVRIAVSRLRSAMS